MKRIFFGFLFLLSLFMLVIVMPMALVAGHSLAVILLGGLIWIGIGVLSFRKFRALV